MGSAAVLVQGSTSPDGRRARRGRRRGAPVLTALAVAAGAVVSPSVVGPAAAAQAATCRAVWGSTPEGAPGLADGEVTGVRSGRHACFDRVVVDVAGPVGGHHVRYVDAVTQDGSGARVPLRGGARLLLVVGAPAHDDDFRPTYAPADARELVDVRGASTLRQVALAGSFEGQTTVGVGVRARLPFRSFVLTDGTTSRLVLDVAHRW
ncbi:AMIN-like domain-containing (lipo)protein [Pseudokineococcus sp. 1T1Z-3]|uniref:AMIN-like domain-containing (lipo)protein n=1 Tax=Pseudokineococcus sp. 1T1Z-3 TaxID=3132745 RepID=UPI00309C43A0